MLGVTPKPIVTCSRTFSRALRPLHAFVLCSISLLECLCLSEARGLGPNKYESWWQFTLVFVWSQTLMNICLLSSSPLNVLLFFMMIWWEFSLVWSELMIVNESLQTLIKGATSSFMYFEKNAKLFKIVISNPFQSSPSSTILVLFCFRIIPLVFLFLSKPLF